MRARPLAVSTPSSWTSKPTELVAHWWARNRAAITHAFIVCVTLRAILSVVAVLAAAHIPEQQGLHYVFHGSDNTWLTVWARWDSEWFLDIAQNGYASRSELIAFFPLYPVLTSTLAPIFNHDYVLSGVIVSSVALFVALVYLFKLVAWEFEEEVAGRSLLYLAIFPTALFLLAVYSESTFLAASVATFYYARRGEWSLAGVAGLLAALTRSNGILLVFPLAYEVWRQNAGTVRRPWAVLGRLEVTQVWAVAAPLLALGTWVAYLAWLTHDPLAYAHRLTQPPWSRPTSLPWNTLWTAFSYLGTPDLSPMSRAVNTFDLAVALLLVEAAIVAWWYLPRAYALYLSISVIVLFSTVVDQWPLQSLPRYAAVLFPCFIMLAQLGSNRHWDRVILLLTAPVLGLFTGLFAAGYWIF